MRTGNLARCAISAAVGIGLVLGLSGWVWPGSLATAPALATASPTPAPPDLSGSSLLRTVPFKQVAIGDCTDISPETQTGGTVKILDCAYPHASEVFDTLNFPDVATLQPDALQAFAERGCGGWAAPLPASVTWIWLGPTADEWASGDRFGLCLAVDSSKRALTEPLSQMEGGPAPAPAAPSAPSLPFETSLRDLAIGFAAVLIPFIALTVLFALASYVLWSLALTSLFRKVGIPVWKAWVPYVQTWTLLRLGGQDGNWVWLSFIPYARLVTSVFVCIGMHRIGIAFNKDSGMLVLGIFLPFVWAFILGGENELYRPELLAWRGYPPPLEGYGSVPAPADSL